MDQSVGVLAGMLDDADRQLLSVKQAKADIRSLQHKGNVWALIGRSAY
jgi:hypothetical protein